MGRAVAAAARVEERRAVEERRRAERAGDAGPAVARVGQRDEGRARPLRPARLLLAAVGRPEERPARGGEDGGVDAGAGATVSPSGRRRGCARGRASPAGATSRRCGGWRPRPTGSAGPSVPHAPSARRASRGGASSGSAAAPTSFTMAWNTSSRGGAALVERRVQRGEAARARPACLPGGASRRSGPFAVAVLVA